MIRLLPHCDPHLHLMIVFTNAAEARLALHKTAFCTQRAARTAGKRTEKDEGEVFFEVQIRRCCAADSIDCALMSRVFYF